jgi:cyanophycinase
MHPFILLTALLGPHLSQPQGHLVIVGGGPLIPEISARTLAVAGGKNARVLVIPQASCLSDTGQWCAQLWHDAGARRVDVLDVRNSRNALVTVAKADLIWIAGGDQAHLMEVLKQHGIIAAIHERYLQGATVAGTSAGAAVMSLDMLTAESKLDRLAADTSRMAEGLGLWPEVIVDQHHIRRCRFNRLLTAVLNHPDKLGVGIDECTAVVVSGRSFEVIGESNVFVIDARKTRMMVAHNGEPEAAANVSLHVLKSGMKFDLDQGLLSAAPKVLAKSGSSPSRPVASRSRVQLASPK